MKRLIGIIILAVLLTACAENNNEETQTEVERVVPVETVSVTKGSLVVEKSIIGRLAPESITPVILQAPGEVTEVHVKNGDRVEEGDAMIEIMTMAGAQTVSAPASGEIAQFQVSEEDLVSNEEPLAMILNMDVMTVSATVTSQIIDMFEIGDAVQSVVGEEIVDAEITNIDKIPNETGLYPLEARIEQDNGQMLPGMVAILQFPEQRVKDAIIVPTEAIVIEEEQNFVYVVEDDQAIKVPVDVIETQSDETAIEGDVNVGDAIVVNGQLTLEDGRTVQVVKEGNES